MPRAIRNLGDCGMAIQAVTPLYLETSKLFCVSNLPEVHVLRLEPRAAWPGPILSDRLSIDFSGYFATVSQDFFEKNGIFVQLWHRRNMAGKK